MSDSADRGEEKGRFSLRRLALPEGSRQGLRFMLRYVRRHGWAMLASLVALLLSTVASLAFPALVGQMVDAAAHPLRAATSFSLDQITLLLAGAVLLQALFGFARSYLSTMVAERVIADVRHDLFTKLIHLPISFFHAHRVGELTSRLGSDVGQVQYMITTVASELLRQGVTLAGGIVLVLWISPRLTLVVLLSVPLLVLLAVVFGRLLRKTGRQMQDLYASLNTTAEETFQGIAAVKSFTAEGTERRRYDGTLASIIRLARTVALARGSFWAFITLLFFGGILAIVWYGGTLVQEGRMSVGSLTSFVLLTLYIGAALGSFADLYSSLQGAIGASTRIRELMQAEEEAMPTEGEAHAPPPPPGPVGLRLEKVSFAYPSRPDLTVLREVTLDLPAGRSLALVGPSGAGKSTIVSLLLRFHDPTAGEIAVGGEPLAAIDRHAWRRRVAVVPQEVFLFGGTIRENIAYGLDEADEERVRRGARLANADEFISGFPEGYETIVGERGVQLSGGQRQRVAIARAILRDPSLLILDEATSSLDVESEQLVQEALERVMRGRTTLVIAHRLSTIRNVDAIAVLKEGSVVEYGTYAELMALGGIFARMVELQSVGIDPFAAGAQGASR